LASPACAVGGDDDSGRAHVEGFRKRVVDVYALYDHLAHGTASNGSGRPIAVADIAVYANDTDRAKMFRAASLVFKDGELVVRDGAVTHYRWGRALTVAPGHDRAIERRMQDY